jgi:hypothetical protein
MTNSLSIFLCAVDDVEDCVGMQQQQKLIGPPLVPDRCRQQALKLEICIAAHQIDHPKRDSSVH